MKVIHCSTSVSFSSANYRMHIALVKDGIQSEIITLHKNSNKMFNVHEIAEYGKKYAICAKTAYYLNILEYLFLDKGLGLMEGMPFTTGKIGWNICGIPLIKEADIIHIHCVNGGFLSISSIRKLIGLNKPIIITLHDSWFLTGGCHVLCGCEKYKNGCKECREILRGHFLCKKNYEKKRKILENENVFFIAPSRWTYENYIASGLDSKKCVIIGNTLDFSIFNINKRRDYSKSNNKIKVLFGALNSTKTPYKGFEYLVKMLNILYCQHHELAEKMEVNIFGAEKSQEKTLERFNCKFWGYVDSEVMMAELYNRCDVYIVPSLEDSFNQTVLESCACGTPVVSFRTGGICDIIRHKETGYLAEYKNETDLLDGLLWILSKNVDNCIGKAARKDVQNRFAQKKIGQEYIEVYRQLINWERLQ